MVWFLSAVYIFICTIRGICCLKDDKSGLKNIHWLPAVPLNTDQFSIDNCVCAHISTTTICQNQPSEWLLTHYFLQKGAGWQNVFSAEWVVSKPIILSVIAQDVAERLQTQQTLLKVKVLNHVDVTAPH